MRIGVAAAGGDPPGVLYVVASTLGNPADLSPRAVRTLGEADLIFAEDTRTARRLLESHGIDRPLRSCFDANEAERAAELAELLRAGKNVALVSEAGTPAVSDPGYRLVRAAIDAGARVVPVPGPSALLAALVASGLPTDRFLFLGFPPRKPGPRRALFEPLAQPARHPGALRIPPPRPRNPRRPGRRPRPRSPRLPRPRADQDPRGAGARPPRRAGRPLRRANAPSARSPW